MRKRITVKVKKIDKVDQFYREGMATLQDGRQLRVKTKRVLGELEHYYQGRDITALVTHHNFCEYADEKGIGYDPIRTPNP